MFYQPPSHSVNPSPAWDASRLGWLALAHFEGFGTRTLHKLSALSFDNGAAAWAVGLDRLEKLGISPKLASSYAEFRRKTDPQALAHRLETESIRFVLKSDPDYPPLLKQIADPPFTLFMRGQALPSDRIYLGLVGTRNCTNYGKNVASTLSRGLAQNRMAIVSGLALGIDAVSHQSALEVGGYCVAVLGGGCDENSIYPRHNLQLAHAILEACGTILTEFPPGTEALKHHFPLRNRIISGLSRAVIVVEAAENSGSLITAQQAVEQNRDVFAVPGSILNEQSAGTNKLLKLGAIPCTGVQDILDHLSLTEQVPTPTFDPAALPDKERQLFALLDAPLQSDEIVRHLELPAAEVSGLIVSLELKGLIADQGGRTYARNKFVCRLDD